MGRSPKASVVVAVGAIVVVVSVGCARARSAAGPDGGSEGDATFISLADAALDSWHAHDGGPDAHVAVASVVSDADPAPVEARRARVTRLESEHPLAANAEVLRDRFGGKIPAMLAVQSAELSRAGRRALLVTDATRPESEPIAMVLDATRARVWTKEHPTAGITPPTGPIAIAGGPLGRVVMAVCHPPTASVALRVWDEDGAPFADYQALDIDACTDVSVIYWPRRGWILAAASPSGTRAQRVTEDGALAWGRGLAVGAQWRRPAPASLAADTDASIMLVQYARSSHGAEAEIDRAVAFRYDTRGTPLWASSVDLGAVGRVPSGADRITLTRPSRGLVRASLPGGRSVVVRSSGDIVPGP